MKLINLNFYKRSGFYVSMASVIMLLVAALVYTCGFTDVLLEYNKSNVLVISIIGIVFFIALLLFKPTSNYAPLVLWIFSFISFLLYVTNVYMYFTGVFYNGVSLEAFKLIDGTVILSSVLFLLSFITANVAMYMNHSAKEETN